MTSFLQLYHVGALGPLFWTYSERIDDVYAFARVRICTTPFVVMGCLTAFLIELWLCLPHLGFPLSVPLFYVLPVDLRLLQTYYLSQRTPIAIQH